MTEIIPKFAPESLLEHLGELEISFELFHHVPVFTVAEADKVSAEIPGLHTRNLFLKDKKGNMVLVTLGHETPIDLKKLSNLLNMGRFSFGSPERLWENLGVRPGSVTPLAILNNIQRNIRMILEAQMMDFERINVHPLDNSMTVSLAPQDLMTILEKHAITPQIIDLGPAAPDKEE
ncbi:MAG TPA: prolyl-tRNA synthetase associated domain-containing protein [Alphaproteobacteria bacterium]|nr:prolyl-tRNA synthetase associated domain-containing protein [Alphaproteobacteria bacterium]HNS43768.1 prolyl-tRNA synthetase associated domain-containing protein [Alphaproteobacteria bacterium]